MIDKIKDLMTSILFHLPPTFKTIKENGVTAHITRFEDDVIVRLFTIGKKYNKVHLAAIDIVIHAELVNGCYKVNNIQTNHTDHHSLLKPVVSTLEYILIELINKGCSNDSIYRSTKTK